MAIPSTFTLRDPLRDTDEIDIYTRGTADPEDTQNLIEATLGSGSYFRKTFKYHVDAVSPKTAKMLKDWETRAIK